MAFIVCAWDQGALISVAWRNSLLGKQSDEMSDLFWLTDAHMARLAPFLSQVTCQASG